MKSAKSRTVGKNLNKTMKKRIMITPIKPIKTISRRYN